MENLNLNDIKNAKKRIDPYINSTPILTSSLLNEFLGHEIYFKAECFQKIGAFKARGGMNTMLWLKEQNELPKKVVAFSSGNHAQAVSWSATQIGIESEVFMPKSVSKVKLQATQSYGAKVTLVDTRQEAEDRAKGEQANGAYLTPPFDHDQVICGQGTAAYEAILELGKDNIDCVIAPCGGGGLLSGTLVAAKGLNPNIQVIGAEPLNGNDVAISLKQGSVYRFDKSPDTLADGARTLAASEKTFHYLKQLDEFYEISEKEIIYWTQWLQHLLKVHAEPTSAMPMGAAVKWLREQKEPKKVLIILSGGNMDAEVSKTIWSENQLEKTPSLNEL